MACLIFAFICSIIAIVPVQPLQRPIPYQQLEDGEYVINLSLNETFDGDTVPDGAAAVLAVLLPLLTQLGLTKYFWMRGAAHATICCYLVALGITVLTTFAVKTYVGYLRPAFYDLCEPTEDYSECTLDEGSGTFPVFQCVNTALASVHILRPCFLSTQVKRRGKVFQVVMPAHRFLG